jgi:serine/threonine protein kinase
LLEERAAQKPAAAVPSQAAAAKERATIEFEVNALHACAHAHVVGLLAAVNVGADTYIAMERCEGDLMQFIISPRALTEAAVAKMMRQACRTRARALPRAPPVMRSRVNTSCVGPPQLAAALAHVHEMGIIHLDVKPANVLLAADGGIRLADFGVAARAPAPLHHHRCGTPLFAAPEVVAKGAAHCAADAWSYGVLVYLLLVGFPPFFLHAGGTRAELDEQVLTRLIHACACLRRVSYAASLMGLTCVTSILCICICICLYIVPRTGVADTCQTHYGQTGPTLHA